MAQLTPGWPDEHMVEAAWGLLANCGAFDHPEIASPGWHDAAVQWSNAYHRALAVTAGNASSPPTSEDHEAWLRQHTVPSPAAAERVIGVVANVLAEIGRVVEGKSMLGEPEVARIRRALVGAMLNRPVRSEAASGERAHEISRDCWCGPTVEPVAPASGGDDAVAAT